MKNRLHQKSLASVLTAILLLSVFGLVTNSSATATAMKKAAYSAASVQLNPRIVESKDFAFSPGAEFASSHFRTFIIPAGLVFTTVVTFKRLGPQASANDIPITIELHRPNSDGTEGPMDQQLPSNPGANQTTLKASTVDQTVSLRIAISNIGCSNAWRLRVRFSGSGTSPNKVLGTIQIRDDDHDRNLEVPEGIIETLPHNITQVRRIRNIEGKTGSVTIKGKWVNPVDPETSIISPKKLIFTLFRPNGAAAASFTGESQTVNPPNRIPKMEFTYRLTQADALLSGNWTLTVANTVASRGGVSRVEIFGIFKTGCN